MPTLYLSAPKIMADQGSGFYRDFYTIQDSHIGPDYAIYGSLIAQVHPGMKAVVFDRTRRLRAEGFVSKITPKPSKRVQRYDLEIPDLTQVPYIDPPGVNRCGIAIVRRGIGQNDESTQNFTQKH